MSAALKTPLMVLLTLVFSISLLAQETPEIEVTNVRFDRIANDWIVATVQITAERNPLATARNVDYMDDVRLTMNVCYEVANVPDGEVPFDFYRSSVRMVSLEQSVRYSVYFFLPGVVRDRDDLDVDPFAWLIEMEVGGTPVAMETDQAGGEIKVDAEGYENFLSRANSMAPENDGIFLPMYLAPDFIVDSARIRSSEVPSFYRFELEN